MGGKEGINEEQKRANSPLELAVAKRLQREKKPIRIRMEMAFGGHDMPRDLEWMDLKNKFEKADLILLEGAGMPKGIENTFNALSRGEEHPPENYGDEFAKEMFKLAYNCGKPILFWDMSSVDPRHADRVALMQASNGLLEYLAQHKTPLEEAMKAHGELVDLEAKAYRDREEVTVESLDARIAKAVRENPILKTKDPLNILSVWGSVHATYMYSKVKSMHSDTTRALPVNPYTFTYTNEYLRTKQFGTTPSTDLAKKAFTELVACTYVFELGPRAEDWGTASLLYRKAADVLLPHLEKLYELAVIKNNKALTRAFITEHIAHLLPDKEAQSAGAGESVS